MIIYLSMILWVILMRLFCAGEMKYTKLPYGAKSYRVSKTVAALTMAYIVFWVGMRSGVADTQEYIYQFELFSNQPITEIPTLFATGPKGPLWHASVILFKNLICNDYHAWLMSLAIFMGGSVAWCYQRYAEAFFFCVLIFILNGNFTWMFNGMRQFSCVCVLLLAFSWIIKGKFWYFAGLVAVLSLVHFSVWLMLPIYFISRQKPWSALVLLSCIFVVFCTILAEPLAAASEEVLKGSSAGNSILFENDDGAHPLRVAVAAVPAFLAFLVRKNIEASNNPIINICVNMSVLTALLYLFAVFTSGVLMGRLPIYCEVFSTIGLPAIINRYSDKKMRAVLYTCCLVGYVAYFVLQGCGGYYVSEFTGVLP